MRKTVRHVKKIIIGLIGFPLIIVGLILIPLPGPGLLIMLAGLIVLSNEFDWAQKYVDKARLQLKKVYDSAKGRVDKIEERDNNKK